MILNGNAGAGTVNAITKNLRKTDKLIKLNYPPPKVVASGWL